MIPIHTNFKAAITAVEKQMVMLSYPVQNKSWQSSDISEKPEMQTRELYDVAFKVQLRAEMTLQDWAEDIGPNMPWAEEHFAERVSGLPVNPGKTWLSWPWSLSADKFRKAGEQFSHNYMERYWPRYAGTLGDDQYAQQLHLAPLKHGIRYPYGDLQAVVNLLAKDPLTRQAYLPVWFPEDTGVVHGERVPCTLGYHFLHRGSYLHSNYFIRSCDITRHFRDDLYLSLRLQLWILEKLRQKDSSWNEVQPGFFSFHCVSMHAFLNDYRLLKEKYK